MLNWYLFAIFLEPRWETILNTWVLHYIRYNYIFFVHKIWRAKEHKWDQTLNLAYLGQPKNFYVWLNPEPLGYGG